MYVHIHVYGHICTCNTHIHKYTCMHYTWAEVEGMRGHNMRGVFPSPHTLFCSIVCLTIPKEF